MNNKTMRDAAAMASMLAAMQMPIMGWDHGYEQRAERGPRRSTLPDQEQAERARKRRQRRASRKANRR